MIYNFDEFKVVSVNKYGCVMMKVDLDNWNDICSIIDPSDAVKIESDPHVTVLYGILNYIMPESEDKELIDEIKKFKKYKPVIKFGMVSIFEGDPEFDVVKVEIESDGLKRMNDMLKEFPHVDLHSTYIPHMTIAYVKKGTGSKYINNKKAAELLNGKEQSFRDCIYSKTDGSRISFQL